MNRHDDEDRCNYCGEIHKGLCKKSADALRANIKRMSESIREQKKELKKYDSEQ
jgi:hypothetical protein